MAGGGGGRASDSQCGSGRAGRICGREGVGRRRQGRAPDVQRPTGRAGPRTTLLCHSAQAPLRGTPRPSSRHEPDQVSPQTRPMVGPWQGQQPCRGPARGGILPRRLRSRPFGPRERRAGVVAQGSELKLGELSLSAASARPPGKGDLGPEVLRAAPGSPSPSCLGDPAASPGVGTLSQPHLRALPAPQLPMPADPCWLAPSPARPLCRPLTEGPEEPGGTSEIPSLFIPAVLKATAPRNPPPHNALQNGTHFGT
nr:basic proline-rich protein-like [Delphinus delphis]